ncbi:hypothetical protein [Streptomyces sp. SID4920]|nr:hypothetical protein [Streptomyces sp. SID4920]
MEYHLPPIGTVATRLAALSAGVQPATIRERTASNCQTYIGR